MRIDGNKEDKKMRHLRQITVTPSKARELTHLGFILKFVMMHLDGTDTYEVYVK